MKKKWLAVLTVLCLMVTMVAPAVYADDAADGADSTTVTRIEGEAFAGNPTNLGSTTKGIGNSTNASGGQFLDDMRAGNVFCLGTDMDLTTLESVTMAVGHTGSGVEYGLYVDGTKGQMGYKIATIIGESSGGWQTFKPLTATIDVPPAILSGTHTLYLRVDKQIPNQQYCGNLDYIDLTFGEATSLTTKFEMELLDGNAADAQYRNRSNTTKYQKAYGDIVALDGTYVGNIFYLGDYDLTGLNELSICLANEQKGDVVYSFYIGGTKNGVGTKIASITDIKTGSWSTFKEYTLPVSVSPDIVAGRHTLWLVLEGKNGYSDYSGNFDYITFTKAPSYGNALAYATTYSFNNLNADKSSGSYNLNDHIKISEANTSTNTPAVYSGIYCNAVKPGAVLAYDDINLDNADTIAFYYLPSGTPTVHMYKGGTEEENLVTSFTLDSTSLPGTSLWYTADKLRVSYFDLSAYNLSGSDTIYFKMESTRGDWVGNFVNFRIFAVKHLTASSKVEAETYTWGLSPQSNGLTWAGSSATVLGNTQNGEIFYLGRMDLTDLERITVRMATCNAGEIQFYADMVIPEDLTRYSSRDRYTSATGLTGGTLLSSVTTTATNGTANYWEDYTDFSVDVNTDLTGEHDVYMAMVRGTGTDFTGNIDYVKFTGVESVDTTTNLMGDITIVGNGSVTIPQDLNYGQTATLTPSAGIGYEFVGWDINGELHLETKVTAPVNANNNITAYFVEYGASLPFDNVTKVQAEDYIWGVSDQSNGWNNGKTDVSGNKVSGIDNTKGNDTFYLGKMDLTDLKSITARAAKGSNGNVSYAFYADMTVDSDSWETVADRKYKPTSTVTGGTLLATVTVGNTDINAWNNFTNFTAKATALTGEHDVYVKMMSGDTWHGYIDAFYFEYENTASVSVSFVGKYNETIATETATSVDELAALLENTKAPTIPGFTFMGWDNVLPAEGLFETYKNDSFSINAVYEVDASTTYAPTLGADFTAADGTGQEVNDTSALTFDARVTVTASLGKKVAYWVLDGAKVGFGESSYTFYVSGSNNIDVVYADEVSEDDSLTSSVVLQQSMAPYSGSAYTFSVVAQTSIVGDDTVTEYGVIYAASLAALEKVRGNETANILTVTSSKKTPGAQYITHLLQVKAGKTRYAMAYAIINGNTVVYSTQYATVTTPTDGSMAIPTMANFQ